METKVKTYAEETMEIVSDRVRDLPNMVVNEVQRLLASGQINRENHSRGLLIGVAIENVADLWLRGERFKAPYRNLKRV